MREAEEHRARKQAEAELRESHRTLEERVKIRTAELEAEMTARKKTDDDLRLSEERQRLVLQASALGTFEVDLLTGEGRWNATEFELLGLKPGDVKASPDAFFRYVHPDDVGKLQSDWEEATRTGKLDSEFRIVRADGRECWLAGKGSFIFDGHPDGDGTGTKGKPRRFMGVNFDITGRKKAEEEAHRLLTTVTEEKEKLAALINSIQDEIWFADTRKQFSLANPAALHEFGLNSDADAIDIQKFAESLEVYRPDGSARPVEESPALRALEGEVVRNQEEMIRTPATGEIRHRQVSSNPIRDAGGQIIGSVSVVRDITEQKAAELELERARNILTEAQKIAHLGSFEYMAATRTTVWSEEEYHIYGLDPAGPSPSYDLMLEKSIYPDDAVLLHETFTTAMQSRTAYELEHRIVRPDGSVRWVYDRAHPYFDKQGNLLRYVGATQDITERKRAEDALRESEGRLRRIAKAGRIGFFEWNASKDTAYWSPEHYELFGYEPGAPVSWQRWLKGVHPEDREPTAESASRLLERGRSEGQVRDHKDQYRYVRDDGSVVWMEADISVEMIGGEAIVSGSVRDISERKDAEIAMKCQTEQLEAANKELESFSYSVSHDLKAPLRAIDGFSRKLEREYGDKIDEKLATTINVIRNNAKMMGNLIEALLSFSKVQKTGMNIAVIDMHQLVAEVWNDILDANKERGLKFKANKILPGYGDRALIRQVFFNLLSNAVKFTKDRQPAVIEVNSYPESGKIVYSVKDNGAGFDMGYYDKLFGVFQRLHSHDEYDGTGIGLAIVQRIVKRHGGDVWAKGEVNKGATFYFFLVNIPFKMSQWEALTKAALEQSLRQTIRTRSMDELLSDVDYGELEEEVRRLTNHRSKGWHVCVNQVMIESVQPNAESASAMDVRYRERIRAQGLREALVLLAQGYRQAKRFGLSESEIYRETVRRTLEAMSKDPSTKFVFGPEVQELLGDLGATPKTDVAAP